MAVFMSIKLFSFLILPVGLILASYSSVKVETNVQTNSNEGTFVKTEAKASDGESSVKVNTNQSGSLEVKVENGEVSIKKSQGMQPTIIITTTPDKVTPKVEDFKKGEQNNLPLSNIKDRVSLPIYNFLKGFWMRLFKVFNRKT